MLEKKSAGEKVLPAVNARRRLFKLAAGLVVGVLASGMVAPSRSLAQPTAGRRILIAYYSRSGSTRDVAKQIHARVAGELFELKTVHRYPDAYRPTTEQAKREQEEGFRPVLASPVVGMASYDTVFIGFPNWWGTLPMVFFTFLEQYKLAGKTVIPFCTHEGSGFGRSLDDIRARCGDARILDGLALRGGGVDRVGTDSAREDINRWLDGLGVVPGKTS